MLAVFCLFLPLLFQSGVERKFEFPAPLRSPSYSSDGALAFELNGDLWMMQSVGDGVPARESLIQLTSGPAWDQQPSWVPGSRTLVFSSDRDGTRRLWRVLVDENASAEPEPLTRSSEADTEPAVSVDGKILFVRGRGSDARLWLLENGNDPRRLSDQSTGSERSPSFSPDGQFVAYVFQNAEGAELRVHSLHDSESKRLLKDRSPESPRWSPRDALIVFATRGRNSGVWVTPADGSYVNRISPHAAEAAWSPDGRQLALAELPAPDPSYNGDPARLDEHQSYSRDGEKGFLSIQPAPAVDADVEPVRIDSGATLDQSGEIFEHAWSRLQRLYYRQTHRAEWEKLAQAFRPRALGAQNREELGEIVDQMISVHPPMRDEVEGSAAVSSAHELASQAGLEILQKGGNVVDAAVAVSFALGVVEPDASGIGGYGEMVLFKQGMERPVVIEFLTRVPEQAALSNGAFLRNGDLPSDGPILANVPGTVAGMGLAWRKYGSSKISWAQLLEPAITLAENGFTLDEALPTTLAVEKFSFLKYEDSRRLFFPEGKPWTAGQNFKNPDLGSTLRKIATDGVDAFYRGEIARKIVSDLRSHGHPITLQDMSRYFAVEREAVAGTYRGHTLYSSAPASSGGAALISKLNLLEQLQSPALYSQNARTLHAMIEAWKLSPSSNGRIADPGLWPIDLSPFLDKSAAAGKWKRCFDEQASLAPAALAVDAEGRFLCESEQDVSWSWGEAEDCPDSDSGAPCRSTGTTAFALADQEGNMVAVTQTLGTWGGNFYVSPGLGFLYNDKLRSYSTDPTAYNARIPFARNGTSIAPTLVFRGTGANQEPFLALGAAGNAWITSAVYQLISAVIDGGLSPQRALEQPRFLVSVRRSGAEDSTVEDISVQVEDSLGPSVFQSLLDRGHRLQAISLKGELRMGYGSLVMIENGRVKAGADPRRSGKAVALP